MKAHKMDLPGPGARRSGTVGLPALAFLAAATVGACGGGGEAGRGTTVRGLSPSTPRGLEVSLASTTEARLHWDPSIDDGRVTGYGVYRNGDHLSTAPTNAAVDPAVPPDRRSCYAVSATDDDGNESPRSVEVCVDPQTTWITRLPAPRGDLRAIASSGQRFLAVGEEPEIISSGQGTAWVRHPQSAFSLGRWTDVLWDGSRFVAVGERSILRTTDGADAATTMLLAAKLWALAWSGQRYVAVGADGSVFVSSDAVEWVPQASGTKAHLNDIVWSGREFIAVGNDGAMIASPDGLAWTPRISGTTETLDSIAHSGSLFVALAPGNALSSRDGETWTPHGPPGASNAVTWAEGLGAFVAVGHGGRVAVSAEGRTWRTTAQLVPQEVLEDVVWANGILVTVGTGGVLYTSRDGDAWMPGLSGAALFGVDRVGEQFVAFGAAGRLALSSDGVNWELRSTNDRNDILTDVAWSGSRYVFGGYSHIVASPDLGEWSPRESLGATASCASVTWTGLRFVAACTSGVIRTSADGTSWDSQLDISRPALQAVASSGNVVVILGREGKAYRSADGQRWTPASTGVSAALNAVDGNGKQFLAVGAAGTVLLSTDGSAWTAQDSGVTATLHDVAWTGKAWLAVGDGGAIINSLDGSTWSPLPGHGDLRSMTGVAAAGDRIVVTTREGEIFSLR